MAEAWHIARSSRTCAHSGAPIPQGEPFFSALVDKDDSFDRLDFTVDSWSEVDKAPFFSYWKNKGAVPKDDKRPQVDYERLLAFFDSLEGAEEQPKRLFRYVLALILIRRRHLRLDDMSRTDSGDRLVVYDRRTEKVMEILAPEAAREDFVSAQEKLNHLFECDFDSE